MPPSATKTALPPQPSFTAQTLIPDWGPVGVTVTPQGLVAVLWGDHLARATEGFAGPIHATQQEALRQTAEAWLAHLQAYFAGERRAFPLPIAWQVLRPFQRRALQAVFAIPYGETRTYGEIAAQIGQPGAARAVGRAVATNPMPIVIPCHRVVGAGGKLHGFSGPGGLSTKARLLALEQQVLA